MKKYAIIVAGGKGLRMGQDLPKQFISVGELPILMHAIRTFHIADKQISLILVLPHEQIEYWKALCELHCFKIPVTLAEGGSTRFHSVKNGLRMIDEEGLVAIHDGVRPFVATKVIEDAYHFAEQHGGAIPVIDMIDSVREMDSPEKSIPVDRDKYKLVQTPQTFRSDLIRKAYEMPYDKFFTDDASVFEASGHTVYCFAGNRENIKITTPFDLLIAEALIG
ncbi:MAG: 2-C-methyl-D-erythritol 4-phosphate cytidylyltransferase [Bacteroidales bacterium]